MPSPLLRWASSLRPVFRRTIVIVLWTGILAFGVFATCLLVPIASSGPLKAFALARSEDLREEQGWDTFVQTVAQVRDTLTPAQRASLGIVTANYGEQGAVEILGRSYGLPAPISTTNSAWLRGYPTPPPTHADRYRASISTTRTRRSPTAVSPHTSHIQPNLNNEESKYHPDIFVCGPPRLPWPEFWKKYQRFG